MFKPGQLIEFRDISGDRGTVTFKHVNSRGWYRFPTASIGMYVGPAAGRWVDCCWRVGSTGIVLVDDKLLYVSHNFIKALIS